MLPKPALFLDRDGTLIEDLHYLSDPNKVRLLPGVRECLSSLKKDGWLFFLFSNQSGIRRGLCTLEQVNACNQRMLELIGLGQDLFAKTCLALGTSEEPCEYRKPSPKFILECLEGFCLDPNFCWMIGDKETDVEAGQRAGIRTILMQTQSEILPKTLPADFVCKDFFEVFDHLREKNGKFKHVGTTTASEVYD